MFLFGLLLTVKQKQKQYLKRKYKKQQLMFVLETEFKLTLRRKLASSWESNCIQINRGEKASYVMLVDKELNCWWVSHIINFTFTKMKLFLLKWGKNFHTYGSTYLINSNSPGLYKIDNLTGFHIHKSIEKRWFLISGGPGGTSGKEPACQCRRPKRPRFNPWVWTIPWRRAQQPAPVFLPGESQGQMSLMGYSP